MLIKEDKKKELEAKMTSLNIFEKDIEEKFILGSGSGGQKIQKTHSCVYVKHIPTGVEVKCQKTRSRDLNRFFARRLLCEKIEEIVLKEKSKRQQEIEKIKRQKKRKSRKQKQKMIEEKRVHSQKIQLRKIPKEE